MFINYDHEDFCNLWESLSKDAFTSPFYKSNQLSYTAQRPKDEGMKLENLSFIMLLDNQPVAGFIGATVEKGGFKTVLAYEMPALFVEKSLLTKKARKNFLQEFDRRINDCDQLYLTDYLHKGIISTLTTHLLKSGAKASPRLSQVINLTVYKNLLWSKIRKSYCSLINSGLRDLEPKIMDRKTVKWEIIQEFRDLHIREAGKETRSLESWKRQFDMVKAGEAFVIIGKFENELVTAGLFSYNKTNCYYWVSASRRDLFDKPLFHAIMWTAILHAKDIGLRWFEVGEQLCPNHPIDKKPTKKELSISDFKAGFGSDTRVFLDLKLNNSLDGTV